jgi:hypothetical protein|tara:strand:- start:950 stop:1651 length:702 start_codon:yes stop_codon:yes gene_type:complete
MKRYAAIYGFLAVFFTTFTSALPIENAFEGSLRFNVSFTGGDMEDRAQVAMMVPESYKLYIKGNKTKVHMRGGMIGLMMGDVVIDGSTGRGFVISHMNDTAYEISADPNLKERVPPVILDEEELITIAGYECKKYKVVRNNPSGAMIQYMWVTNEIQMDLATSLGSTLKDSMPFWTEGLSGFPLKITTSFPGTPMSMTLTVTEVNRQRVDPSIFAVPAGYAIESLDTRKLFGR